MDSIKFYWNMNDVIGWGIIILFLLVLAGTYLFLTISDWVTNFKRKRKKR